MSRLWILSIFAIALLLITPFAQAAQKDGLILFLPLNDGSGDSAANIVGDNAKVNGASWVSTGRGGGLEFNGKDNSVEIPLDLSPQAPENQGAMSICAWVKVLEIGTDTHGQTRQPIVMKGNGGQWEYALYVYDNFGAGLSVWTCAGSGVSEPSAENTLPKGEWHHTCGTWTVADGVKVYVDGAEVAQRAADPAKEACDGEANIFLAHREDGQFLNAVIDEVAMWDRALSVEEINANMNGELTIESVAVEPTGKLATTWADVRRSY